MFKKIFNWKTLLVSMSAISILFVVTVFFLNTAIGEAVYSKIFPGNVLVKGNIYVANHHNGGDQGLLTGITGRPNLKVLPVAIMTDGSADTVELLDTAESNWTAINARTTIASTPVTGHWRVGDSCLQIDFANSAVAEDGAVMTAAVDLQNSEFIGFWLWSSRNTNAGDFILRLDEAVDTNDVDVPEVFKNTWTWVEVDISGVTDAEMDTLITVSFMLDPGAVGDYLSPITVYLDAMFSWSDTNEIDLGVDIVDGGVLSVVMVLQAFGSVNTPVLAVEYTDYFTAYRPSAVTDIIVDIADNSLETATILLAFEP